MNHTATRHFTPARMIAITLIALVALGLAFFRLQSDTESVSVPAGAAAGDLDFEPCTFSTEDGDYAAECGTLVVPENRANPQSRLIALPVVRIPARSADPGEPIFYLQGGPGITNTEFPYASRFADDRDVVLVGYRGVDGSVRLDCPEVVASREGSRDLLATASIESDAAALGDCVDRLRDDGADLAGYSIVQRIEDFELVRHTLGYGPINLVSESFGTRVALLYAWRYPESIHRSVMVGTNPPGHFLWYAETADEQLRRYADLCAEDDSCRARTDDLAAAVYSAYDKMPDRWLFLPIKKGNNQALTNNALFNATPGGGGPIAAPMTLDTYLSINEGDASGAWLLSVLAQAIFPQAQIVGDVAAMGRVDAAYAEQFFASPVDGRSHLGTAPNELIWAGGRMLDVWPANPDETLYNEVRDSDVETLLVGGELDLSTPPQVATRELLPHLQNGSEVVLPGLGHTEDFWANQPAASTRLIETYLDSGRVDTSLYTENRIDFTPSLTHGDMAKMALAVLLGSAALTVLSLLWMAWHIRRRGQFGPKTSAALRSVYPLVLGVAGWFLGVLIVLIALPTVFIGNELLGVLAVGIPIALCVYFAWLHLDWSTKIKIAGLAGTAVGALVGAWFGINSMTGLLAPVAAALGATAAANLSLILLDISRTRQQRRDVASSISIEPAVHRVGT